MGGVRNGVTEEVPDWDLNKGWATMWDRDSGRQWKDNTRPWGREGAKGISLVGHEELLCGFGFRTRDPGDTADGAGDCGRPAQLSTD